jgi:hypothetical protein
MRHHPAEDDQSGARDRELNPRQQIDALVTEYRRDVPKKIEQLQALSCAGHLAELIRDCISLPAPRVPSACGSWARRPAPLRIILISCGRSLDGTRRAELDRLLDILRHEACTT